MQHFKSGAEVSRFVKILIGVFISVFFLASCVNTRKATYFNDLQDSKIGETNSLPEPTIRKNDILGISVSSLNPEATEIYNLPNSSPSSVPSSSTGYLVNANGYIQFPVLGSVKADGLTKEQLRVHLTEELVKRQLLVDPIISIRFQNFRVTVLGEVKNPSVIPIPNERVTLLEAVGLAGDLTIYAKRDNVLVIREVEGVKTVKRLNLNSTELFTSPYYYLQSNDVVYVQPNKAKVASASRSQQWIPITLSALSVAIIAVDRINR